MKAMVLGISLGCLLTIITDYYQGEVNFWYAIINGGLAILGFNLAIDSLNKKVRNESK